MERTTKITHVCNYCWMCNEMIDHTQCECVCVQSGRTCDPDCQSAAPESTTVSPEDIEKERLIAAITDARQGSDAESDARAARAALAGETAAVKIIRQKYDLGLRTAVVHVRAVVARPKQQHVCTNCGATVPPAAMWCEYCDGCCQLTWI